MNDIDRFSFFRSYAEALEKFKYKESQAEIMLAIKDYVFYDIEPTWTKKEREKKELVWTIILPNLNASKNKSNNAKKNQNKIK